MSADPRSLLDAGSLMLLMKKRGDEIVPKLGGFCALELTTYEMGNILWKECCLSKSLTKEEAASLASTTQQILTLIERISMNPQDIGTTLLLAEEEGLTFYDASYLKAASDRRVALVTDDARLRRVAKKHVAVRAAADL